MASIDEHTAAASRPAGRRPPRTRWQHPRLLALLCVLALGASVNAVASGGYLGSGLQWQGLSLFAQADAADGGRIAGALEAAVSGQDRVCNRMREIVETACGFSQRDHDREGMRQCVAGELKYTMWSAYGCN